MSHVVVTVGTNPLPVVVGTYRLALEAFRRRKAWPRVTLLYTRQTTEDRDRVLSLLQERLPVEARTGWSSERVIATDPVSVRGKVCDCDAEDGVWVLHYTGGSKMMAVHAWKALDEKAAEQQIASGRACHVYDYYLDPGTHKLLDSFGLQLDSARDERLDLPLTIRELAALHGFVTEFTNAQKVYRQLTRPEERFVQLGEWLGPLTIHTLQLSNTTTTYGQQLTEKHLKGHVSETKDGDLIFHSDWTWPDWFPDKEGKTFPEHWNESIPELPWEPAASGWILSRTRCEAAPAALRQEVARFFGRGGWMEMWIYGELRKALERFSGPADLFGPTCFAPADETGPTPGFEIDGGVVLGYQLLAISCTTDSGRDAAKKRGFEAYHRARQIGGDGARALVISTRWEKKNEMPLAKDIELDLGQKGSPLSYWGQRELRQLGKHLRELLREGLEWR